MRALIFNEVGAPELKLKLADIEKPDINSDRLLVKVLGSSINPSDYMFIEGNYRIKPNFPQAAGLVGAGIVERSGTSEVSYGTLVAFRSPGAWAEYISITSEDLYVLSKDMPISQASQFALNPITAYALLKSANVKPNDWIMLTAGNSSVARLISQIATIKNINTISIVREKEENLLSNEQTSVVVWRNDEQDLLDQIYKVTNNEGASALIDAVGGKMTSVLLKGLKPNSQVLAFGLLSNDLVTYHNSDIIFNNLKIKGFGLDNWLSDQNTTNLDEMTSFLDTLIIDGRLKLPVHKSFSLDKFQEALDADQDSHKQGKIIFEN